MGALRVRVYAGIDPFTGKSLPRSYAARGREPHGRYQLLSTAG